jgi:glutathione S-transferase
MLLLYHNDMSLCAQKVRVCLAEKGLEWESRHLVLRAGEHQQSWYRKLNRRAVVPNARRRRQGRSGIEHHPRISR